MIYYWSYGDDDTFITKIKPVITASVKKPVCSEKKDSSKIKIRTMCKNGSCTSTYDGPWSMKESCIYHPGFPELRNCWSCCDKPDLNAGCTTGHHLWQKSYYSDSKAVKCRCAASSSDIPEIKIGTMCKNDGCTRTYNEPRSMEKSCIYHPGFTRFHKCWSCCRRPVSCVCFNENAGCTTGHHLWQKSYYNDSKVVKCQCDFYQTRTHAYVSIYSKLYSPYSSIIKLTPVRLYTNLEFPEQSGAAFTLDVELNGIIDVEKSEVNMLETKLQIKMKKAEPRIWPKLEAAEI